MAQYICIDGGTTNTRLILVSGRKVVDTVKISVGAQKSIDDKQLLKNCIREGITELLERNQLKSENIDRILASGMITSEFGLVCLPHINTPAGIRELKDSVYETSLYDLSDIPFVFIRGVRTGAENLDSIDMMRGEETELFGLFCGRGIYVLTGSHSKIIDVDSDAHIIDFKTMLTGEMISAISKNTILKDAVDINTSQIDKEYLVMGYHYAEMHGLNEGLFKVRILKNILNADSVQTYSFYMGLLLFADVNFILSKECEKIVVGGNSAIKTALSILLQEISSKEVIAVSDDEVLASSALGAVRIFENRFN